MAKIVLENIDRETNTKYLFKTLMKESQLDKKDVGEIRQLSDFTTVEIFNHNPGKILQQLSGSKINGERLQVDKVDISSEKQKELDKHIQKYQNLVEKERKEQMKRHRQEIKNLSPYQRQKKGRAILDLKGKYEGTGLGNKHIIKFKTSKRGKYLPKNEISVGDLVMISKNKPLDPDNPTGSVIEQTKYSVTVVFDQKPPKFLYKKNIRMDLYVNDISFQRMNDALERLEVADQSLQNIVLGYYQTDREAFGDINWINSELNDSQEKAVRKTLEADSIELIQGPPGTGKTTTAIEVIRQHTDRSNSILASCDSNAAVDNILEKLIQYGVNVVRVGHPARVDEKLREHCLDYIIQDNEKYKKAQEFREKAFDLKEKQKDYKHPSGRWRRGMSDSKIQKLAKENRSSRGVPKKVIKQMAKWLELNEKIDKLFDKVDKLEDEARKEILQNADVVCSTNITAGSSILDGLDFDVLVMDEATQASEPSSLISMLKADKYILIGDHKQLPPTVLSQKAQDGGLKISMFERLINKYPEASSMLSRQYRMHNKIMKFSSQQFYKNNLQADQQVANWTLENLENVDVKRFVNLSTKSLTFIDSYDSTTNEKVDKDSNSFYNPKEVKIVQGVLDELIEARVKPSQVGIITPYKAQVDKIKQNIDKKNDVKVDTIDSFQGREREVIILSFVRSNQKGNTGFLKDLRRLNVSITRAKKKLIVIGDSRCIESIKTYDKLVHYIQRYGQYLKNYKPFIE